MAFSVSFEAPCVSATVPLPPSLSPMAMAALVPASAMSSPVAAFRPVDRALRRQHVPGDDREAFLAELGDVGVDRRIGPIDADGVVLGAGERRFGERQRGREYPSWWRSDCRRLRRCSRAPCTYRGSPPASAGAPDGPSSAAPRAGACRPPGERRPSPARGSTAAPSAARISRSFSDRFSWSSPFVAGVLPALNCCRRRAQASTCDCRSWLRSRRRRRR